MSEPKFTYGRTRIDSQVCPAKSAGFEPSIGHLGPVVDEFDQVVRENGHPGNGIINGEKARDYWNIAIERRKDGLSRRAINEAQEVLEHLEDCIDGK